MSQGYNRIDAGGAPRRNESGARGDGEHDRGGRSESHRIRWTDLKEQPLGETAERQGSSETCDRPHGRKRQALTEHCSQDLRPCGTQRQT